MVMISKGMYDKHVVVDLADGTRQEMVLKPLPAKYLPKLFKLANELTIDDKDLSDDDKNHRMLEVLSRQEVMDDLVLLCTETLKKSYPDLSDDAINEFVTINGFTFITKVFEVNIRTKQ